jgi:hypothetical protein
MTRTTADPNTKLIGRWVQKVEPLPHISRHRWAGDDLHSVGTTSVHSVVAEKTESVRDVVIALGQARRKTRRTVIDFWEAIYQAYVAGFVLAIVVAAIASVLPQDEISAAGVMDVVARGPALLGLFVALAAYIGIRSGIHGGPLVFEAATVHYVFQSPVDRAFVARRAALKQLRTAVTWGFVGGSGLGLAVSASLPGNTAELVLGFGAVGGLAGVLMFGAALVASGRPVSNVAATIVGVLFVGWSVADVALATTTSPLSLVGHIGLWPLSGTPLSLIGVALVAVTVSAGVWRAGEFSLEASLQRAGLVSQIRFALTMNDLRTVVLLRRRLANHSYRSEPWLPVGRSKGLRLPVLRRTVQSQLRQPLPAVIRLTALGIGAGASVGLATRGVAALALIAGLLMLVAGYDVMEPLAQEVDNPGRWATYPRGAGDLAVRLTVAGAVSMLPVALLAGIVAVAIGGSDVAAIAIVVFPLATVSSAVGASVSTLLGGPDVMTSSELFGLAIVIRLVLPPIIAALPFAPVVVGLVDGSLPSVYLPNSVVFVGLMAGLAWTWISQRNPGLL